MFSRKQAGSSAGDKLDVQPKTSWILNRKQAGSSAGNRQGFEPRAGEKFP